MHHVLACGDSFHGLEFPERDRARERLRERVAQAGLSFVEHSWIWDATHRAQLLVLSTSSPRKAHQFRSFLERHGIEARITSRLPSGEPPSSR
jgi:hypothetical protein